MDHVPILYKDDEGLDRPDPGIRVASFSDTPRHKASELATFIVEACNAHDALTSENSALRDALRRAVQIRRNMYGAGTWTDKDVRVSWEAWDNDARSALAKGGAE